LTPVLRGTIVFVEPDPAEQFVGREQNSERPCVIVSNSNIATTLRYNVIAVVPLTRTPQSPETFYPLIKKRQHGLSSDSYALPEMIRVADKSRVKRRLGQITQSEMATLETALRSWLKL
jgi:mRNA-degrading endonuclease toxin of MazEF toxin-antitoxin module